MPHDFTPPHVPTQLEQDLKGNADAFERDKKIENEHHNAFGREEHT